MAARFKITTVAARNGPEVLVVDFATATADEELATRFAGHDDGRTILRADVLADLARLEPLPPAGEIADGYAECVASLGLAPSVVVGYCSASALATRIAAQLPGRPATLLVEPTWIDDHELADALRSARESLGMPDPAPPAGLHSLAGILSLLESDLHAMIEREGIPEDEQEIVLSLLRARYRAWFGFLVAEHSAREPEAGPGVTVVLAQDSIRRPAPGWVPGSFAEIRLPVAAKDLRGDNSLRRLALTRRPPA